MRQDHMPDRRGLQFTVPGECKVFWVSGGGYEKKHFGRQLISAAGIKQNGRLYDKIF